jgi:ABC-2 type transport system permease protein
MRVFASVMAVEARKKMSYRVDFWLNAVVAFFAELAVAYFIVVALFSASGAERLGGLTRGAMIYYYVVVILIGKLVRGNDMEHAIAGDIYEGSLSRFLVYPAPFVLIKYAQALGGLFPAFLQFFLFGAWAPIVLGSPDGVAISPASVAMGTAAILVANLLHFLVVYAVQLIAFWADNVWSLMVAHRIVAGLLGGVLLPLSLFPEWTHRWLDALPFKYMFAFPVDALLGRVTPAAFAQGMAVSLAWCAGAGLVAALVWRRGTLQYTGVGM